MFDRLIVSRITGTRRSSNINDKMHSLDHFRSYILKLTR